MDVQTVISAYPTPAVSYAKRRLESTFICKSPVSKRLCERGLIIDLLSALMVQLARVERFRLFKPAFRVSGSYAMWSGAIHLSNHVCIPAFRICSGYRR
jgi:hypothetical protein